MKKYLSFNGYTVKHKGKMKDAYGFEFIAMGRLVNINSNYSDCEYVSIYFKPGFGYVFN